MRVCETMTRDVQVAQADDTIARAAELMAAHDAGVLPVRDNGRLVGIITDRDIAVRAVAARKGPETPIREVMSRDVTFCFEDQDIETVARAMGEVQLRRLPVMDRGKRLVGIVSIGDVAVVAPEAAAGGALIGICRPGGAHNQT
ncbi:CBS domain-containing protein [Rhodoblastus acidophilus]|uniref:CBS domain-containing protein n=1 Tax=Rhodoblastus acidophilus TaxID=1074 RepID=UPI00160D7DA1|nr:CBS domain-containing protein [Rhodoblastus acidophilus]MCW2285354.1 CBS domain-containing protein [Rhodoblastus acidophilus]MCW2334310.1 CBS domain-containing protein [Rhodoblastus acidophilus]